jgi:hypothetical protein
MQPVPGATKIVERGRHGPFPLQIAIFTLFTRVFDNPRGSNQGAGEWIAREKTHSKRGPKELKYGIMDI